MANALIPWRQVDAVLIIGGEIVFMDNQDPLRWTASRRVRHS